jgi:DNA-binding transcriptional LysR family regulator
MMLDLESVRLFVLAVEYANLTRAAEAAGTVQPVVSQRIKALEEVLGYKLLDRSPRHVRLTEAGAMFLDRARRLMAAHDDAVSLDDRSVSIALGVSDHVLGISFEAVLKRLRMVLPPHAAITMRLGQSQEVRALYESRQVDLAIIRREGKGADGEILGEDPLDWRAPVGWALPKGGAVPLISLPPPCAVRAVAVKALERAGLAWHEAFVGGSCLAVAAAVRAGLGVAPLGRMVGADLPESASVRGLPQLPASKIVMLARTPSPHLGIAARALAASVRDALRAPTA